MCGLSKINILIGQNNSGKSNVIRFIHEVLGANANAESFEADKLNQHLPSPPPILLGLAETVFSPDLRELPLDSPRREGEFLRRPNVGMVQALGRLLKSKAQLDGTGNLAWSYIHWPKGDASNETWIKVINTATDNDLYGLWNYLSNMSGGDRSSWSNWLVNRLSSFKKPKFSVALIPAVRRIGEKGTLGDGHDGLGLIERLARLQNPSAVQQHDKHRFEGINEFLREVTGHSNARIEIPYERDTILIHMNDKVLPIEYLGSGLHEVVILAATATTLDDQVVCMEEPELHLNPILQKKFIRHLVSRTTNQYFITTHSAALMDTPDAEIFHVSLSDGASRIERVTTDAARRVVCEELGYHASDLLQANSIIWVEGPSDRLYLNWWLATVAPDLAEGIHYSIMFYGGKLAAHLSGADEDGLVADFIKLRALNRRGAILMDSDKANVRAKINATKRRLAQEFESAPGLSWITAGREVENYVDLDQLDEAIRAVLPSGTRRGGRGQFDNLLLVTRRNGVGDQVSKVEVARYVTSKFKPNISILDVRKKLINLVEFIRESNPKFND